MPRATAKRKLAATAALTIPALKKGEIYGGALIGPDGKGHHIIVLAGETKLPHEKALAWAKKQGGDLMTRPEGALLFAHLKKEFQEDWYWTNETHARNGACAWSQVFGSGYQSFCH